MTHRPRLHFIGICGKGMGAIAEALAREGWEVSGSDESSYPPMSSYLDERGIQVLEPALAAATAFDADLYVVGKRVREENPVLTRVLREERPRCSFPVFLHDYFLKESRNVVVAGGVGKTTTTAMLAWILEHSGRAPDYFIGGIPGNFSAPARLAGAAISVLEGDEYASCFDDPRPKFMHYPPEVVVVTNVLEDHPDLYQDLDAVREVFADLVKKLPESGLLVVPDDDASALQLANEAHSRALTTGFGEDADRQITNLALLPDRCRFRLEDADFEIPLCGTMNVRNVAMAALAAVQLGVSMPESAEAMQRFISVENRQDSTAAGGCTVVSDKASHPFALRAFIQSLRQRYPDRRLVSVLQARATGGRDWVYQGELPAALEGVDLVLLANCHEHNPDPANTWEGGAFSVEKLESDLQRRSVSVVRVGDNSELPRVLCDAVHAGDVIALSLLEQSLELKAAVFAALAGRHGD